MEYKLLEYISLDDKLIKKLTDLAAKDEVSILCLSEKFFKGNTACLFRKTALIKLAVTLKAAEKTYNLYKQKGISDDIFKATFSDIKIWCENCGNIGLKNINWLSNHIGFKLFRIGRLQFQLYTCSNSTLNYSKLPFNKNEKVIYIHIPQGEKLDYNECVKSISMANSFFKLYFPDYSYNYYFCESWLLFENNRQFMNNSLNIIRFMGLFDINYSVFYEAQAFERIFDFDINVRHIIYKINKYKRKSDIEHLSASTSLQKSAKQYLLSGNKLGIGVGTIPKNRFNCL